MPLLIIEPPPRDITAQTPLAFAFSGDGQTLEQAGQGLAALLPRPGKGTQVVLVVPVQLLSWHRIKLPKVPLKDRQRLRAVLQGLLEDQLLDDVSQLHFSLAPDAAAGQASWVSVCRVAWLESALDVLAAAGLVVQRIVPAFAPEAPAQEDAVVTPRLLALGTEDAPWLVIRGADGDGQVLALPLTPAAGAMDLVAALSPETVVDAEPAVYQLAQQRLGRPVRLFETGDRLLQAAGGAWSLAQFQFANSGRDRLAQGLASGTQNLLRAPQWRPARWGLLVLVLAQLLGVNVWAWQARQQLDDKRDQINSLFATTFPSVPVVVDAPLQMRRELQRLQQQSGALTHGSFEVLAAAVGATLPAGQLPQTLQYEGQSLLLGGLTLDDAAFALWQAALAERGLQADWQDTAVRIALRPGEGP
ncbi:general secretion pathway protein GspL [Corticibacter populi]|uniref:General secretion pathway protein GspL n=1 Tax=Corticibacter populi TaxID=1550736 RepID=A0A3M6QIZ6_9BURK|nr:type II secretion system protein GspL [Corticibacter populi]RMX02997.1 general secretion pathway protein GspL [Corticibacter populi]RZS33426.1 general secretion pathway protein L [Corticibacter populi]